ncbi:MAG: ATP-dependent helicase [Chitinophagaceae bacterium]
MSFQKEKLHQKFTEEYNRLNEHQRKAVDAIEGPVMVIAGPGTGKTQILSARVGKILLETDTDPSNILCLTYTDNGAINMRRRLQEFIGSDAYKVNIYTFHAFCNDVIQENLSLFEKNSFDPISELERTDLLRELIDLFPNDHPLKRFRGNVYYEIYPLKQLYSTMKREGWTPEFINKKIDAYINDLPNRSEFIYKKVYRDKKAGDPVQWRIDEEKDRMERLRGAVNEFDRFQQMMRSKNRYDFDDMINWVLRVFKENKNVLANYQERFQYILVDEYQDTSGTQNELVNLLISYWEKPNVFVVGDDDQSIFRFQGANVENMHVFSKSYKDELLTVVLTHNYRSTQPILDISRSLINRNYERLINKMPGLTKELISSREGIKHLTQKPVIKSYETQRHEMIDITTQVEKLLEEGVEPCNIGIIYKENKYGEELAKFFKFRNIPFYSKRSLNILEIPLAQKIIQLLKYVATEHEVPYSGDELLFEILHFDWFNIQPIEIAKLSIEVADKQFTDEKISLRQLLHQKINQPPKDLFSQPVSKELKRAGNFVEKLIADASNVTLQCLFESIIREGGVLNQIMQSNEKHWLIRVLTGLFDFVKEETRRNPTMNAQQLVHVIELMEKEDLALPLLHVSGSDKGVNLLTAHGAKGLEFEYVFFAGVNSNCWENKKKPGGGFKLPDTVFASSTTPGGDGGEEELRRLFYVALTRAEQHLTISYCCCGSDGKDFEPSMFIAEIRDEFDLPIGKVFIPDNVLDVFSLLPFGEDRAPEIEEIEQNFVNLLLEKFVMNVTALNNYMKCPLEFYFKNLVRIPSPKNENIEFGSAVHYALETLFRKMKLNNDRLPPVEEFVADFEWYMKRHRESFTKKQYENRTEYGKIVLTNYYNKYVSSWNKIVLTEQNIKHVFVEGVPLKGKLDKLEFTGNDVNVVDYKTGDSFYAIKNNKLDAPNEKCPAGGDYWRQAVFYKILMDNNTRKKWQVVSSEFDFIEPDKKKNYVKRRIFVTPADITTVTQQIKTVWDKIQAHDFYKGCGKPECHWCNFVKTNNLAVALHELQDEDNDLEELLLASITE